MLALAKEVSANVADEAEKTPRHRQCHGLRRQCARRAPPALEIVWNLAENAIKYSKPEGGRADIDVSTLPGGHVRVTVSDDGLGIPREAQDRVFERFYRVDKSHSRETGGTASASP